MSVSSDKRPASNARRVLVVDDDLSIRSSLKKVLEGAGYEVVTTANDREAEAQFHPEKIDLVLLDLNLPAQSGWDIFERVTTRCPTVPVIIITGMPDQYRTARAAGASALMEKPLDASVMLSTMERVLAEPHDARLRRMCGYHSDTAYIRASEARRVKTGNLL